MNAEEANKRIAQMEKVLMPWSISIASRMGGWIIASCVPVSMPSLRWGFKTENRLKD